MASKIRARNLVAPLHMMELVLLPVLILFTFGFACARVDVSSSHGEQEKWSVDHHVVVRGRVFCDPCLQHQFQSDTAHFLPGALVAVECTIRNNSKLRSTIFSTKAETDEYGDFRVELSSCIYNLNLNPITSCSVRLLNSPHHSCNIPSISTSSLIKSSNANGLAATYTSHPLSYRLQDVPHSLCTPSREEEEEIRISSEPRGRTLKELSRGSKSSSTPPPTLPNAPSLNLPKLAVPPLLPNAPPLPKLTVPPLPKAPPLPKLRVPPLPKCPSLPKLSVPPLNIPKFSVPHPPLLTAPPMPKLSVPPLPNVPPLPKLNVPPLNIPNSPPLNLPNVPPFTIPKVNVPPLPSLAAPPLHKLSFPPLPQLPPPSPPPFQFPPLPFFTPPSPSTNKPKP